MSVFTTPQIREAWQYAELAYKSSTELSSLFGRSITTIEPLMPDLGDACHVINEGERVVVVFPGSNDIFDWASNLDARDDHGLHAGFLRAIDAVAGEILDVLTRLRPDSILITGHSRGGALAHMFLEQYSHLLPIETDIDCITFGEPRIAKNEFYQLPSATELPNVNYLRVYVTGDPVNALPSAAWGWTHHGPSLRIGKRRCWLLRWARSISLMRAIAATGTVDIYRRVIRAMR